MNATVRIGQSGATTTGVSKSRILIEAVCDRYAYGLSTNRRGQFHRQRRIALEPFSSELDGLHARHGRRADRGADRRGGPTRVNAEPARLSRMARLAVPARHALSTCFFSRSKKGAQS